jgi:general stress protein CsbA
MSFLAGNIGNMRLPCAAVAQEALKVEPGSNKAELVATLGIAGSIITNLIVVTIAAVAGNQLFKYFPPVVIDAFGFVLPGIFGAMFAMFAIKYPKYGAFALTLVLIMLGIIKILPVYVVIPVSVFSTIAFAYFSYKKQHKNT